MYGIGLRSIRTRFAIMIGSACLLATCGTIGLTVGFGIHNGPVLAFLAAICVGVPTWITYSVAGRLTGSINALRHSTDAIVAGNFDRPIDIDCSCEVGGLQESYRRMVQRLNSNITRMNVLAYSDPLTGLSNRSVVVHMLEMALPKAGGSAWQGALFFIDLDGFKSVNDTMGHESGDELLRQVADRIVQQGLDRTLATLDNCSTAFGELCQRPPEDIVFARFAGDEFVAILPGQVDRTVLCNLAEKISAALLQPFSVAGHQVMMSASIGIAQAPVDTSTATELLSFADLAMYEAKQSGKGCYAFFDEKARNHMVEQTQLEAELRIALKTQQLCLFYQPKIHAQSLVIQGVEALVRWNHPRLGLIGPGQFIDLAERAGLICELGQCVMQMALTQAKRWFDEGTPYSIAVNVSPTQFRKLEFVDQLTSMIAASGVDPHLLELEITESVAMGDFVAASTKLSALRELGIRTSIDDFGVGHSNLTQLVNLPFDSLKIDMSLISEIGDSEKSEAVIIALIGIASALGHPTIAEGIETFSQYEFLRRYGCNSIQGYYFAKPMNVDDFSAWVVKRVENNVVHLQRAIMH